MLIRRLSKEAIPVVVLAGYLGSGKTTVLNHILRTAVGARIAVIVNDFGSVNIDSMLISAQTDNKLELTNGCICCSMDGGELEEALATALEAKPDVVIVEASGLAEPEDLARQIILSPNQKVGYGGLVYLVDAVNYPETIKKHWRMKQHIELADLVVLAKAEHITEETTRALVSEISELTKTPIIPVRNGELAPELLFDIPDRVEVQPSLLQQSEVHDHDHLHDEYRSVTFESTDPISPEKLRQFLNQPPQGVYRVKGIVYFGMAGYEQKFVLQSVGGRWDMYAEQWSDDESPRTVLVAIGSDWNEAEVLDGLRSAIGESKQAIDIERYISS